jgi:hypothetical protein
MMMGDIVSPPMVSPTATIECLWDGEPPEFETPKEAAAFLEGFLGLWNHLTRHHKRSHPFRLVQSRLPSSRKGLKNHCRMRLEEIHALLKGLLQGEEEMDVSPELSDCVATLEDTAEMFAAVMQTLADENVTSDETALVELRENLRQVVEIANRECADLVWKASDYRKSQLAAKPPDKTVH